MSSLEYITACELCGPNAPEFEQVLEAEQRKSMRKLSTQLKSLVQQMHKAEQISDEVCEQAFAHLNEMRYEN